MRVVGFQWVWETLLLTWVFCGILLPKIFCTDKAPFCTDVWWVSSPKCFLSFLFFFQKWSQILYKTSYKKKKSFVVKHSLKERERERRKYTFSLRNTIISFIKTCCRFILVVRIIVRRPLWVFCEKKALVIKERRFDFYERRDIFESFFLIFIRRRLCYIVVFVIIAK